MKIPKKLATVCFAGMCICMLANISIILILDAENESLRENTVPEIYVYQLYLGPGNRTPSAGDDLGIGVRLNKIAPQPTNVTIELQYNAFDGNYTETIFIYYVTVDMLINDFIMPSVQAGDYTFRAYVSGSNDWGQVRYLRIK